MNANDLKRLAPAADAAARSRRAAGELGSAAADRGLLDVAVATMDSPVGDLLIAVTPRGLARVAFDIEPRDEVLEEIAERVSPGSWRRPRARMRGVTSSRSTSRTSARGSTSRSTGGC